MVTDNDDIHVERDEARAGSTPGVVRYVLGISLVLIIVAFAIIVTTGVLNSDQHTNAQESSQRAVAEQKQQPKP